MTQQIGPSLAGTALSNRLTTLPIREDTLVRLSHLIDVTLASASLVTGIFTPEECVRCQNNQAVTTVILRYRRIRSINKLSHQSG